MKNNINYYHSIPTSFCREIICGFSIPSTNFTLPSIILTKDKIILPNVKTILTFPSIILTKDKIILPKVRTILTLPPIILTKDKIILPKVKIILTFPSIKQAIVKKIQAFLTFFDAEVLVLFMSVFSVITIPP